MVVAAWRATGHPSAGTTDPFDGGAVPCRLILRPAHDSGYPRCRFWMSPFDVWVARSETRQCAAPARRGATRTPTNTETGR
jgi:hypothetical protein